MGLTMCFGARSLPPSASRVPTTTNGATRKNWSQIGVAISRLSRRVFPDCCDALSLFTLNTCLSLRFVVQDTVQITSFGAGLCAVVQSEGQSLIEMIVRRYAMGDR